ncbi:hypothetical protein GCM10007919_21150 [Rhizobium indigoferae]|nr:hypothetical protein GCM10007919_21150 [Rhizobium indigoferae]
MDIPRMAQADHASPLRGTHCAGRAFLESGACWIPPEDPDRCVNHCQRHRDAKIREVTAAVGKYENII